MRRAGDAAGDAGPPLPGVAPGERAGEGDEYIAPCREAPAPVPHGNVGSASYTSQEAPQPERQPSRLVEPDHALGPAGGGADVLADRERVEEFVGDDDGGTGGSAATSACQVTASAGERRLLRRRGGAGWSRRGGRAPHRGTPAGGVRRGADRPSACRGPVQARRGRTGDGAPIACQVATAQRPISSPKIWLTSGAVTKSPARPNGSRAM